VGTFTVLFRDLRGKKKIKPRPQSGILAALWGSFKSSDQHPCPFDIWVPFPEKKWSLPSLRCAWKKNYFSCIHYLGLINCFDEYSYHDSLQVIDHSWVLLLSLLPCKIYTPSHASMLALGRKMNDNRVTALPGFNDLGCLVTPILDGLIFFTNFLRLARNEGNLSITRLKFSQNAPSNSVLCIS